MATHTAHANAPETARAYLNGPPIPERTRNLELCSIAGRLRWHGFDADEIAIVLHDVNAARCVPPLPRAKIESIAKWIGKKPAGAGRRDGVAQPDFDRTRDAVLDLLPVLDATPFPGRRGPTERDVVESLLLVAALSGRLEVSASYRQLAELAGVQYRTVDRLLGNRRTPPSVRRWVELVCSGSRRPVLDAGTFRSQGSRWRIRPLAVVKIALDNAGLALSANDPNTTDDSIERVILGTLRDSGPGHDAWRRGGLGKTPRRALIAVRAAPVRSAGELARRLVCCRASAYAALVKLAGVGLVERSPAGWSAVADADLDAITATLKTAGTAERQRAQHQAERESFVAGAPFEAAAAKRGRRRLRLRDPNVDGAPSAPWEAEAALGAGAGSDWCRSTEPPPIGSPPAAPPESWR